MKDFTPKKRIYSTATAQEKMADMAAWLGEHKASDVVTIDLSGRGAFTDAMVVATANSTRHAQSLADGINALCGEKNYEYLRMDGYNVGQWVIVDCNDVVVHIFLADTRKLYQLDQLWSLPASKEELQNMAAGAAPAEEEEEDEGGVQELEIVPTLLLILDGWGIAPAGSGNATSLAKTPNIDRLLATCPHSELQASGRAVGLPEGYMGNSEVGHLNIGAGRIVYQDMTRIDVSLENGEFQKNPAICDLINAVKANNGTLHLAGLFSDGGVHSHVHHLEALCAMASEAGVPVRVHCFMDGRDTPPDSGAHYIEVFEKAIAPLKDVKIAALYGRFYAMDRDKRWDRVSKAFDLLVHGNGAKAASAAEAIAASYEQKVLDEFVVPVWCCDDEPGMKDGDGIFFFNFRADRMREIVGALTLPEFDGFDRGALPALSGAASMTSYDAALTIPVAFPDQDIPMGLGECVSQLGLRQLRLAETEKYAHVTYFFNGGVEEPFEGEERILVPSPREVATYDLAPAMSARTVTDRFVEAWNTGEYSLVVCNLANGDMVGHTGIIPAAIEACETVDECVGRMEEAVRNGGGRMIIIADHGNCEKMLAPDGKPHTAHTTNPVPCILVGGDEGVQLKNGKLADVAVTILDLWGLAAPEEMNGSSLIEAD